MFDSNQFFSGGAAGFYPKEIDQSLRFNDDDSAYLSWTAGTPTNNKIWTFSCWFKRTEVGDDLYFLTAGSSTANRTLITLNVNDVLFIRESISSTDYSLRSSMVFRDPSAWYHLVVAFDTTQATNSNRIKCYINGEQITSFGTEEYPPQNTDTQINSAIEHNLGKATYASDYMDGYLAEVHFTDGTAYDADAFGEFKEGVWVAKAPSVTYGTNGFYLDFANSADIGNDVSGEGNDWTPNNFTASDVVLDSPTDNFCTLNPLWKGNNTTLSEGNLKANQVADDQVGGTFYFDIEDANYYYAEFVFSSSPNSSSGVGLIKADTSMDVSGGNANTYWYFANGNKRNVSEVSYGASYTTGDVIGVAVGNGSVTFYKNNASQGAAYTGLSGSFTIGCAEFNGTSGSMHMNFGQDSSFAGTKTAQGNTDQNGRGDFYYTPPSGYLALSTANLPDPAIDPAQGSSPEDFFDIDGWEGTGTTHERSNLTFQPDWVWIKNRDNADNHYIYDSVRGATITLSSDLPGAEYTSTNALTSFDSDGFTLGSDGGVNRSASPSQSYVGWAWKAGTSFSNSAGTNGASIASSGSANTTSGFSIVSYQGTGSVETIYHGLSQQLDALIIKDRDGNNNWIVYHRTQGAGNRAQLNSTTNFGSSSGSFNSTDPTDTVFTIGTSGGTNTNTREYIAYCFHSVEGFSKFGKYDDAVTGSDFQNTSPFVYLGFAPALLIIKGTTSGREWVMYDTKRKEYNPRFEYMVANGADTENDSDPTNHDIDFVSNGFKIRGGSGDINTTGESYVYFAWAENPFKYSNAR